MLTLQDIRKKYYQKIAPLDLELIFSHITKKTREFILIHPDFKLKQKQLEKIEKMIARRIEHEPISYILGKKEFYRLEFIVNENTLIPRPETELLIELALQKIRATQKKMLVMDIGTGSGNIIITLAKKIKQTARKQFSFFGIDLSTKALAVAKQNSKKHAPDRKIKFIKGDLLEPIMADKYSNKMIDSELLIAANLPYLSSKIYRQTMPDVRLFEPKSALISQKNGLHHYELLLKETRNIKKANPTISITCLFEISPEQKAPLANMIKKYLPSSHATFHKDLAKKNRVAQIILA